MLYRIRILTSESFSKSDHSQGQKEKWRIIIVSEQQDNRKTFKAFYKKYGIIYKKLYHL